MPGLCLVPALRIAIDLTRQEQEMRIEVHGVYLALFGKPGKRYMTKSLRGISKTSWYLPMEESIPDDVWAALDKDPRECDVFYICCEDKEAPQRRDKAVTTGSTVEEYILETLLTLELNVQAPVAPKFNKFSLDAGNNVVAKQFAKSESRYKQSLIFNFSRENYFLHLLRNFYLPAFLRLLEDPVETTSDRWKFNHEFLEGDSKNKSNRLKKTSLWVSWHMDEETSG